MPTVYKAMDRVRTLIPVGAKLPKGSVGVVQSVDTVTYPDKYINPYGIRTTRTAEAYVLSVVFPALGNASVVQRDVEGLDPKSVPHMNAVPFRPSEVELVDSLAPEEQKDQDHV